ncbi:MAG: diguanylate cyclase, partial [Gemmatimonadota bacterium]|nr:diguanylate cyclase [Gemmatimonadota bacterium]
DEFVSVLSDTHLAGAENYVSRVSKRVLADPILGAHGISVSCGMAEFDPQTLNTSHELLKAADRDMYRAKSRKLERAATSE